MAKRNRLHVSLTPMQVKVLELTTNFLLSVDHTADDKTRHAWISIEKACKRALEFGAKKGKKSRGRKQADPAAGSTGNNGP